MSYFVVLYQHLLLAEIQLSKKELLKFIRQHWFNFKVLKSWKNDYKKSQFPDVIHERLPYVLKFRGRDEKYVYISFVMVNILTVKVNNRLL